MIKTIIISILSFAVVSFEAFGAVNPYTHIYYYAWFPGEFTNQPDDCYKPFPKRRRGQCPDSCTNTHRHAGFSSLDIGSVFWPAVANPNANPPQYDSTDTTTITTHANNISSAQAGSAILSYGGSAGLPSLATITTISGIFVTKSVKASFAIRDYSGRDVNCGDNKCVQNDLLALALGTNPAVTPSNQYKVNYNTPPDSSGVFRPVFYIYKPSTLTPATWGTVFLPNASFRINHRFIVLAGATSLTYINDAGFDGFYNYSPAIARPQSYYQNLADQAWNNPEPFIYSAGVSPGYNTWRTKYNACLARNVSRFRTQLERAKTPQPHFVSVISFNEWGEGTQIEPATTRANGRSGVYVARKSDPSTCNGQDPPDCSFQYLAYVGDATNPTSSTVYLQINSDKVGFQKWEPRNFFPTQ